MLTEDVKQAIRHELSHSEQPRQAIPEALKIVQRRCGWVSDEHVEEMSSLLGVSADEIDSVATFYNLIYRRPVGRHVILICDSVSCWITGYENLLSHLKEKLGADMGQTTPDGRFTLLPVVCLGACDLAPVMMVDEDLHGRLTPEKIDAVLAHYE